MTIYIGADYKGDCLKKQISEYLKNKNYEVINSFIDEREVNDYTDFAFAVGEQVRDNKNAMGILICESGHGVCIAANKVKGIRCIRATNVKEALLGREHDGANILALGSAFISDLEDLYAIIDTFINTPYPVLERRLNRIAKLAKYEEEN